jgi:enterochelin esterase-like enzyme
MKNRTPRCWLALAALWLAATTGFAQTPARPPAPPVSSPEVAADRRVTFRLLAPKAEKVRLSAGDIPGIGPGVDLVKGADDVWEATCGPVPPGAFRYVFDVDGVSVIDPKNPATSESNNNSWSLVQVPGADFMDTRAVPHGAVAAVTYYSSSLKKFRRLHVYTPPGYESGKGKFPIFYLLHGAGDSDDSWTSVGRAGIILDNLIAARRAKPMVVVMPAGHTRPFVFRPRGPAATNSPAARPPADEFAQDFLGDIMPYVETHYRVYTDRRHRALAGLSMGGGQTLNLGLPRLDRFGYLGVFSSGIFGIAGGNPPGAAAGPSWEEQHLAELDNAKLKRGLKLFWFSTGKDDFLLETSRASVAMFKKHGFNVVYHETAGGHTWINWRDYLNEFAPQLFQ